MARFETDDGCALHYEVFGDVAGRRPALVFLNGTAQTTINWWPYANRLKSQARVVLYDARCQGRSDAQAAPALARHAADLAQLLDHLGIDRAGLVGLSHGARVALAAARQSPLRIERLMLLSLGLETAMRAALTVSGWQTILSECGLTIFMRSMVPVVFSETFLRQQAGVLDKIVEALVQRNDAQKINRFLTAIANYPPVAATLPDPPPPARILAGEDDPLVSTDGAQVLAERLKGTFRLFAKTGHSIPAEAPEGLLEEIETFFELNAHCLRTGQGFESN